MKVQHSTYFNLVAGQFVKRPLGLIGLFIVICFFLVGTYAPFLASSKPLAVKYAGEWYFPLFRYLFYTGFYTKYLDIFFNILMFILPFLVLSFFCTIGRPNLRKTLSLLLVISQMLAFIYCIYKQPRDPASDPELTKLRREALVLNPGQYPSWAFDLQFMNDYAKLNLLLRFQRDRSQHDLLKEHYMSDMQSQATRQTLADFDESLIPSLWKIEVDHYDEKVENLRASLKQLKAESPAYNQTKAALDDLIERREWLLEESAKISFKVMPLFRAFHWEEDAGGGQSLNQSLPWWELTRINRKDLVAALLFGIRISVVVGLMAVGLSLIISIPIGAFAGYYGGTFDIVVSRLLEIWESMPTFFMLLMIVAVTQSKSIFLVIAMIGLFGWTAFSRYIRAEFFKQRNLPYVEACHALGLNDGRIMFSHILPNAIPPVLTLVPFAVMAAITSEAGLSFLGLGEEGSTSWGVLMDEGRSAFPAESYLLWPPAILLTTLLVAIALVGDTLRDALDPKLHR